MPRQKWEPLPAYKSTLSNAYLALRPSSTSSPTEFVVNSLPKVPSMPIMPAIFSSLLLAAAFVFTASHALPLKLAARDSVDPPITNPVGGDVWHVGATVTVTWDTSGLPPKANVTNPLGSIILGFLENDSENLMLDTPLAKGFSIFSGSQDVTVPDVPRKTNYIIALMGSSGNISPEFQIVGQLSATPSPPISEPSPPRSPVPSPTVEPISSPSPTDTPSSSPGTPSLTLSTPPETTPPNAPFSTHLSTYMSTPSNTPTVPTPPSPTNSIVPSPQGASSDTSDASSFRHVKFTSVAFALVAALFMI